MSKSAIIKAVLEELLHVKSCSEQIVQGDLKRWDSTDWHGPSRNHQIGGGCEPQKIILAGNSFIHEYLAWLGIINIIIIHY